MLDPGLVADDRPARHELRCLAEAITRLLPVAEVTDPDPRLIETVRDRPRAPRIGRGDEIQIIAVEREPDLRVAGALRAVGLQRREVDEPGFDERCPSRVRKTAPPRGTRQSARGE